MSIYLSRGERHRKREESDQASAVVERRQKEGGRPQRERTVEKNETTLQKKEKDEGQPKGKKNLEPPIPFREGKNRL